METGLNLYYPGNTVSAPHPGKKRLRKTLDVPGGRVPREDRVYKKNERGPKICAVSKCVWCGYRTDQYFITCPKCENCQYCGMVDHVDPYICHLCGNYLPIEPVEITLNVNNVIAS